TMKYFSNKGYDVYVFEGPGQGEANRRYNLAMNHHWEKPTSTVLDYFDLDDVTLLGVSMGGYLCFRAAAFDKRIKRVIASSVAYDYTDFPPKLLQPIVYLFYNVFRNYTANALLKTIEKRDVNSWYFANLQYMLKSDDPIEMVNFLKSMTAEELHCEKITQDILILTGRDDHGCPFKMHKKQIDALVNAKSVTGKVFYKDSNGSNHCQIGNIGLSFDVMADWMEKVQGSHGNSYHEVKHL
ncbi:MAG: alpha/beta hydrolase, partial [Desulfobacterales bacterium]|nr:alpha/beta hydrolase [Desulfobacterales bacterium]